MSLNNPNDQKRYVFPARAVQALHADGNAGKTFSLHWRPFIEAANKKAPLDEETLYALDLFSQILFRLSAEAWRNFEGLLIRAENRSGQSGAFVFSDGTPAHENDADLYFDALYASKNTSSQTNPHTLRMIAKYLFAVRNLPVDRAFRFATKTNDGVIPPQPHHELHLKALDKIWVHWNAWRDAEMAAEQQRAAEKAAEQQPHVEPYAFPGTCTYSKMFDGSPKTFLLNWFDFFDVAKEKVGFPQKLDFVLSGFSDVEFTFSREEWVQLKELRERAKQFSNRPQTLLPDGSFACESFAHGYFEHLYARGDNNSSINPNTLRLIAKYLFAVRNLSSERALPFVESRASFQKTMLKFEENKDAASASLHNQVYHAIVKHWQAWRDAEKASDQVEYAQVPESPIQPAEPLESPDMDALMRRAFAAFEEGKPLAETGMVICDAFGLREVYEEQLKDPKNRAILALGETLLRTVQSVLRPSAPPEKPFVMSAPPEDTARPRTPADPPAAPLMSDVVKDMIEKQQREAEMLDAANRHRHEHVRQDSRSSLDIVKGMIEHKAAKNTEIDAAYRQRDEQIRQAKAIADAECQDALDRISRGYAKGEEGVWLPLVGSAQQGFRKQALSGKKPIAQILADLKAKADEQHELSEKIRERFAGKGEDFVAQLRKRIVYGENKGN